MSTPDARDLLDRYRTTRAMSVTLCRPLKAEDYRIQSMPDVSPPWWNLGHTTWFFAKNVLEPFGAYTDSDRRLEYVMNSYYEALGPRLERRSRGLATRPTTEEVYAFRESVDVRMEALLAAPPEERLTELAFLVEAGIHHEQQHQELLLTELKHILAGNAPELREAYAQASESPTAAMQPMGFLPVEGGLHEVGNLEGGWAFDNELPVHKAWTDAFLLADRLVTNAEYLEFMEDGGYRNPLFWLSNGWARVQEEGWEAPLYWRRDSDSGDSWSAWTLTGDRPVEPAEPVCHVSFYEADAFARWASQQGGNLRHARLPTENEWEKAARTLGFEPRGGNFLERGAYHPLPLKGTAPGCLPQAAGDLWEWTTSHYEPYPGYRPFDGNLAEYNGKFMDNQRVLRGGSCATPQSHIRVSYRNFWPADTRFQMTGIRLARDSKKDSLALRTRGYGNESTEDCLRVGDLM